MSSANTNPMTTMSVAVERAERHHEQERHDHHRKGEHGLDQPADEAVDDAPEIALDEADGGADDGAEERRERRDDEDVPGAGDDPREHVAPERVGAEPVRADGARLNCRRFPLIGL